MNGVNQTLVIAVGALILLTLMGTVGMDGDSGLFKDVGAIVEKLLNGGTGGAA